MLTLPPKNDKLCCYRYFPDFEYVIAITIIVTLPLLFWYMLNGPEMKKIEMKPVTVVKSMKYISADNRCKTLDF